jgi:NDP-sugar pyrophosphorylase family protein
MVILAGGYARRLGSLTKDYPKCLIAINGRPFVDWQLDLLVKNGYSDFLFCLSYKSELVQDYLGDGSDRGIRIQYSLDGELQLGTGGAIQKALPELGSEFGVIYGDSYLPADYSKVEKYFLKSGCNALMTVYKNENLYDTSNVEFTGGKLIQYEKGKVDNKMKHIDYGVTFFRKAAFASWANHTVFDLSIVCNQMVKTKEILGFEVFDRFYEIGSLRGIEEFSLYLEEVPNEL